VSPAGEPLRYELHEQRLFDRPVLVIALEGWVDAGLGASTAIGSLLTEAPTDPLATFDGDHFLDQRARRPLARIVDGVTTELNWPETQIRYGVDEAGNDVLYLIGPEPDFHWRDFVEGVVGLAIDYGVRMVVGLGAFPAPAPHTRPVKLAATAPVQSAELVRRVGVVQGELEVPAGVLAALELGFGEAGIDAVSLWARVPHYVAAMPFPDASAALIDGLASVAGLVLDSSMVRKLEESVDASEGNALGVDQLPSGEEIAAELERFLRGEEQ
jgi:hypothetical protein